MVIFNLKNNYGWKDKSETDGIKETVGALLQLWDVMDAKKDQIESQKATVDVIPPKCFPVTISPLLVLMVLFMVGSSLEWIRWWQAEQIAIPLSISYLRAELALLGK